LRCVQDAQLATTRAKFDAHTIRKVGVLLNKVGLGRKRGPREEVGLVVL
jgi:hypothetical protein